MVWGIGRKFKKAVKKAGDRWDEIVDTVTDSETYGKPFENIGDSFSPIPKMPDINIPEMETPPVMPLPDDELVKSQRRKALAAQRRRSGRQSTIYSGDTLG